MDLFLFAIAYLSLTAFFIAILLFGESPVFRNTPIATLHWVVTSGLCSGLEWIITKLCGSRGSKAMDSVYMSCCERPNPALQIAYLAMVGGGFAIYWSNLFSLLPNAWADEGHILIGSAAVAASLTLFVWASASDPGTVRRNDPAALAAWNALYPLDGVIFPPKNCTTCDMARPARSKHCRVCNRCVGRHDHHCQWINNCVGFGNMRVFLAFLVANLAMCGYGTVLAGLILGGEMEGRGMFQMKLVNYGTGKVVPLYKVPTKVVEWLIIYYPLGVAMGLFMLVASLLVTFFLAYQIYLLTIGRTQYEMFKWRDLHHAMLEHAEEQQEAEEQQRLEAEEREREGQQAEESQPGGGAGSSKKVKGRAGKAGASGWRLLSFLGFGQKRSVKSVTVTLPKNIYNRGFATNAWEVLLPEFYFERARKKAVAAAAGAGGGTGLGLVAAAAGSGGKGKGGAGEGKKAR